MNNPTEGRIMNACGVAVNQEKGENMNHDAPSNYEIQRERTRELFFTYDLSEIVDKLHLDSDEEYVYLTYAGWKYRLRKSDAVLETDNGGVTEFHLSDTEDAMTIYDILAYSKPGASPSGEMVQIQNLSRVQNASSYAGEGIYERYGKEYAGRGKELEAACKALGGQAFGKGDVAMRIPLFQDVSVAISFWDADDEFPPVLNLYFDKNMLQYVHYETVWYSANGLMQHIKKVIEP